MMCWNLVLKCQVTASRIFLRIFLKKHKLNNLIKREIHILTTTTIKKYANTYSLQLLSTSFHILKLLHDSLINNATSYISFNIHNQTIIHPLISHSIAQFILYIFHCRKISFYCCSSNRKSQN